MRFRGALPGWSRRVNINCTCGGNRRRIYRTNLLPCMKSSCGWRRTGGRAYRKQKEHALEASCSVQAFKQQPALAVRAMMFPSTMVPLLVVALETPQVKYGVEEPLGRVIMPTE